MNLNLSFFSPIEEIKNELFELKKIRVFIKRDDLIHPMLSGNKWRKLKYILKKAELEKKDHLVTFGGAYSNHLLATAAAAAKFGYKSTGIVRGEHVENPTLFLCLLHGMNLIFEDRKAYLEKELLFSKYFKDNTNAYFINEGGASMEGTLGCSEIISELKEDYDHLFCACGTGTTAAGILNGIGEKKLKTKFHGIPVLKNNGLLKTEITQFLSFDIPFELHEDYHFGGYAKTTEALIRFIKNFIKETGVIIDPVYTGKMLFALFDLIYKDHFSEGSRILAIHTGGLLGLLGMKSRFDF